MKLNNSFTFAALHIVSSTPGRNIHKPHASLFLTPPLRKQLQLFHPLFVLGPIQTEDKHD